MAGPAPSLASVLLIEVLPDRCLTAVRDLYRTADDLDRHRPPTDRGGWHWYPATAVPPTEHDRGISHLLLDTTVTVYNAGVDWLELTLDIAWSPASNLVVNAAVEVACWCAQDHNMHPVREVRWEVATAGELVEAFAAAAATVKGWLNTGPHDPSTWRRQAGLPDAPIS
ncbi:hypothetical protein GCM10027259_26730 [Micromonospora palomenae]|uniref:hypothetical protein n=1 Tax=Micromonospora palomenae TaxID=1461247 RepID=UPI0012B6CF8F|nr:hypothetical protein [Micromonospora palomenae]